jgi:hypothetical protein
MNNVPDVLIHLKPFWVEFFARKDKAWWEI